jgi:hypothetical protein
MADIDNKIAALEALLVKEKTRKSALEIVDKAKKIICVTYTNEHSVNHDSYRDVQIGLENRVVGSGTGHLVYANTDDIVIIRSKNHLMFAVLNEILPGCNAWSSHGGENWQTNFSITPLTGIIERTPTFEEMLRIYHAQHNIKYGCMLNSRLCGYGEKYKPVLKSLFLDENITLL